MWYRTGVVRRCAGAIGLASQWLVAVTIAWGQSIEVPQLEQGSERIVARTIASGLPVTTIQVSPTFTQVVGPTDLEAVPGQFGKHAVTFLDGEVRILNGDGTIEDEMLLNLASDASPSANPNFQIGPAHGLTAIAMHPGFSDPESPGHGRFYTIEPEVAGSGTPDFFKSIVVGSHHDEVLYEYRLADPSQLTCEMSCVETKREIFRVLQPGYHHNLGDLLFDSQGMLLIAVGDGSTSTTVEPLIMSHNARDLTSPFGKILRIDPLGTNSANGQYGIPADNPLIDGPDGNVDEVYAFGLRNPYRLALDANTGAVFAAEVGERSIEAVERIVSGGNHGWDYKEGSYLYDPTMKKISLDVDEDLSGVGDFAEANGLIEPIFEYAARPGGAIVGGVVYQAQQMGPLQGYYLFGDLGGGRLMYGDPETGEARLFTVAEESDLLAARMYGIVVDSQGELLVLGANRNGEGEWESVIQRVYRHLISDLDDDFDVDTADLLDLLEAWSGEGPADPPRSAEDGDTDGDADVDTADLLQLMADWTGSLDLFGMPGGGIADASAPTLAAVPEPASGVWLLLFGLANWCALRRRRYAASAGGVGHELAVGGRKSRGGGS